ncbi:tribbles [Lucilia sericata]|uniref:tribbles n=2 Tax=Lucilia sericata TaxID=13632 RepID=UPI0018A803C9|nr:tribbles [Lucilia sericata]
MDTSATNPNTTAVNTAAAVTVNKIPYSQPGSPVPSEIAANTRNSSSSSNVYTPPGTPSSSSLSTPKKNFLDAVMLQTLRKKLATPGGAFELQSLRLDSSLDAAVNVVKDRYVISAKPKHIPAAAFAKAPSCYRHLVDMNMSNLKCTDIFTGEQFLCKVINEPLHKVQQAYFKLQQEPDQCRSSIYGHQLIRGVKDIVALNSQRTYVILNSPQPVNACDTTVGVFEDLHTYLRDKHRLSEAETRCLFHQICETVLVCHRNGIILRDLKLKRFFFVDEARTKLQYESLEGSMILDNPEDDTLSEKIGCPLYTAPELLCPEPTYKGKPADMWALGVILYTMLVGQYPFFEKGNSNLITIIRQCFVQLPGHLSRSARWLLLSLLRKNISDRVPIEHIFLSPWLKEQKPFHMYIPVDVAIPDDEDDCLSDNDAMDCMDIVEDDGVQPLDYSCSTLSLNYVNDSYAEMG